jgi:hypothetical protein
MKILAAIVLIICGVAIIVASHSMHRTTLSESERTQVKLACSNCHDGSNDLGGDDNQAGGFNVSEIHKIHTNAGCITCHSSSSGLKTADKAHSTSQWAGIGIVALTLAGIVLNFIVVRRRSAGTEGPHEQQ